MRKPTKDDAKMSFRVSSVSGHLNNPCHTLSSQIPSNNGHIIRSPHVVPVMWGSSYNSNQATFGGYIKQLISDIVTRRYMNGLAQYGVGRGSEN